MKDAGVEHVNIADARARLEELVERAAAGETIVIERDDGTAVRVGPEHRIATPTVNAWPKVFDWDEHWRWLESQPLDPRSPDEIDEELRSLDRF